MKTIKKTNKAITTQIIFFILMSLIMIWIIVFGFQRITDVQDTLSIQEEIEIKNKLEEAFKFCSDPINQGSLKIIDLTGRPYNSICFNCHGLDSNRFPQEFLEESRILSEAGSNFLLLKTQFSDADELEEYQIIGQLKIEELGYENSIAWFDLENSYEQKIEILCK